MTADDDLQERARNSYFSCIALGIAKDNTTMPSSRRPREGAEDDQDEDEENEYGVRRSRRATSIANRDSSSLSPAQIMEQEVYYASAEEAISRSLHLAQLLCLLLISYHHYSTMIDNWQRVSNVMADAISSVRDKVHHLRIAIDRLLFLMSWVRAYGEMSLLYAEDLSIYIRRPNRFQPKHF